MSSSHHCLFLLARMKCNYPASQKLGSRLTMWQ
ncbi:hypothetical protein SNOG_16018 [Parastagonospora nodorum SN15]|uniref:Uncharacterized protein n=1 Tax=Phaeosphaeria nodorum (strain SN15 / ATCC MYA-4574 / FGSC 10173) TaxID=321614 RepID=Q0TWU0_PHANO|nr:hypothetical protein SNOG_16018 [Parastagonospora nodorum SN15]EAT76597.1 hypothetical protein SNOG_16018 [Parastagonospora nodorum SN15]